MPLEGMTERSVFPVQAWIADRTATRPDESRWHPSPHKTRQVFRTIIYERHHPVVPVTLHRLCYRYGNTLPTTEHKANGQAGNVSHASAWVHDTGFTDTFRELAVCSTQTEGEIV